MAVEGRVRGDVGVADALGVPSYTITNDVADRVFDADAAVIAETNDVLATLIRDLARAGIINV